MPPPGMRIRHANQGIMSRTAFFDDHGAACGLDCNSPDRLLAKSEAWHPADDGTDADLAPDNGGETFDAAGVDAPMGVSALKSIPRQALLILLGFIIPPPGGTRPLRVAQLRLVTLAHLAGLEGIGDRTLTDLAAELGATRSLMSLYACRMVDQLGQSQVRGGKRREAREVYKRTATEAHRRQGHKMKQDVAAEAL